MAALVSRRQFLGGGAHGPRPTLARIGDTCLETRGIVCRACGDACDARALRFLPLAGGLVKVLVDPAFCNGCGACVPVCPTAAIVVEGVA